MSEQLAGLLGTLVNKNQGYEQSYLPVGFYDTQKLTQPETITIPATSSNVASAADIQIAEATKKSVQESQRAVAGTARASVPVKQPQSVGGDATPPATSAKDTGDWWDNPNATTAFQVAHYLEGAAQGMKAISAIGNGYVAYGQYRMRANSLDFLARQNERNAQNMLKNIREIYRAAQADMSVISEMNIKRKSEQRIAQAASGFAVGKGSYKVLADNTDWKTNFNASMIALKAGLQGAEVIRQAGGLEAQAIINRSDAEIARKNAKMARTNGWIAGIAGLAQAVASFYIGSTGAD